MAKLLPHPLLSACIALAWLMLGSDWTLGALLMAMILGLAIPAAVGAYWPDRPRVRAPLRVIEYVLIVVWDIIVSNIEVAYLVLFKRGSDLKSGYIAIPLAVTTPEAIALFAGTITMTPGTLSADLSSDGRTLLVHCLNVEDKEDTVRAIKDRYERRIAEFLP